jgi:hypothetical protein
MTQRVSIKVTRVIRVRAVQCAVRLYACARRVERCATCSLRLRLHVCSSACMHVRLHLRDMHSHLWLLLRTCAAVVGAWWWEGRDGSGYNLGTHEAVQQNWRPSIIIKLLSGEFMWVTCNFLLFYCMSWISAPRALSEIGVTRHISIKVRLCHAVSDYDAPYIINSFGNSGSSSNLSILTKFSSNSSNNLVEKCMCEQVCEVDSRLR